jgi:hypothetical protein
MADTCFGTCLAVDPMSNETDNLPVTKLKVNSQPNQLDYNYEASDDYLVSHYIRLGQLKCTGQKRGPRGKVVKITSTNENDHELLEFK